MELVAPASGEDDGDASARTQLPRLRVVDGGESWASASDRAMIESTVAAVDLVAAKWRIDVLYLLAARIRRHGRLRDHLLVSKKVLSDTLRDLERDGLVHRRVFAERGPLTLAQLCRSCFEKARQEQRKAPSDPAIDNR